MGFQLSGVENYMKYVVGASSLMRLTEMAKDYGYVPIIAWKAEDAHGVGFPAELM